MTSYVIGGYGRVGTALRARLEAAGMAFEWTSRREDGEPRWFLDLAEPVTGFPWGECAPGSVVYIVAAANGFQSCEGQAGILPGQRRCAGGDRRARRQAGRPRRLHLDRRRRMGAAHVLPHAEGIGGSRRSGVSAAPSCGRPG
jgi:hypothetical protein